MKLLAVILLGLLLAGEASATTENTTYVNQITTQYLIESSVEKCISSDYLVQNVNCNLFNNKSMLVRIYIADSVDANKLRYGNLEMLRSAIRGHALAVGVDPSVEDMKVQICNSTVIHCTMHSARSLISMSSDDLANSPGPLSVLVLKMLSTMTPIIGSHLVSGKFVPVTEYGEYFSP
jgi:hypothetical protein